MIIVNLLNSLNIIFYELFFHLHKLNVKTILNTKKKILYILYILKIQVVLYIILSMHKICIIEHLFFFLKIFDNYIINFYWLKKNLDIQWLAIKNTFFNLQGAITIRVKLKKKYFSLMLPIFGIVKWRYQWLNWQQREWEYSSPISNTSKRYTDVHWKRYLA